ncbi:MAG: hypothetical protein ACREUI_10800 [Burkholderiales bacterium]
MGTENKLSCAGSTLSDFTSMVKERIGPLEQINYDEFDGHRRKRVLVQIIGE